MLPVARLNNTWKSVSETDRATFSKIANLLTKNEKGEYEEYQKLANSENEYFIPCFRKFR